MASILVSLINMEVAKTITSFFALETLCNCLNNDFFYCNFNKSSN